MGRAIGPKKVHRYSVEFKLTAVKLSGMPGVQVRTVANALDIHPFMLSRWRKEARDGVLTTTRMKELVVCLEGRRLESMSFRQTYFEVSWFSEVSRSRTDSVTGSARIGPGSSTTFCYTSWSAIGNSFRTGQRITIRSRSASICMGSIISYCSKTRRSVVSGSLRPQDFADTSVDDSCAGRGTCGARIVERRIRVRGDPQLEQPRRHSRARGVGLEVGLSAARGLGCR